MADWGDTALTFDRSADAWGASGAYAEEGEGGGEQYLEILGSDLWVAGVIDLGRFRRVADMMNLVQGYLVMRDAVVLTRTGDATRLTMPELRVIPDDIALVAQVEDDGATSSADGSMVVEKRRERLVVLTRTHIIDGDVFLPGDGAIMAFVDATDPKFIPMSDVRVRWVADRKLAARYPFALLQRSQILGVAQEGIRLGGADQTVQRVAARKAQSRATAESDGMGGEIGSSLPAVDAGGPMADNEDDDGSAEAGSTRG